MKSIPLLKGMYNPTEDMRQACKPQMENQTSVWEIPNEMTWTIRVLMHKTEMHVKEGFIKELRLKEVFRSPTGLRNRKRERERKEGRASYRSVPS